MFDFSTVLYLWTAQASTVSVLFAVIWFQDRAQKYFAFWSLGFIIHATGVLLIAWRGTIPDFASIQVANTLTLSSFFFWICGLRQCDRREPTGWAAIPALIWIAAMMVPEIRDSFGIRVAVYALSAMTGFTLLAITAATARFSSPSYRRVLACVWAVQAVNGATFGTTNILIAPGSFDQLHYGTVYGMISMACFIAALVIGAKIVKDQSEQRLRQLIGRDPLTGVLNRRGMTDAIAVLRQQLAPEQIVTLLVFDLDHFKSINDTYGHQAGDVVLVQFAKSCANAIGKRGIFSRSGGEEFSAVLSVACLKEASQIAEAIRRRVAEMPVETDRGTVTLTVSIGIATMRADQMDLDELMKQADRALYSAKAAGRNRSAVFSDEKVVLVPTGAPGELEEQIDIQADRQVAVLRRLSAVGAADKNRSA